MAGVLGLEIGSRITSPTAGQELVSVSDIQSGSGTGGYYDVDFLLNSSLVGTFTFGVYDASNVAVKVMTHTVIANEARPVNWRGVYIANGYKLRVLNVGLLLTALVQASVNYRITEAD